MGNLDDPIISKSVIEIANFAKICLSPVPQVSRRLTQFDVQRGHLVSMDMAATLLPKRTPFGQEP